LKIEFLNEGKKIKKGTTIYSLIKDTKKDDYLVVECVLKRRRFKHTLIEEQKLKQKLKTNRIDGIKKTNEGIVNMVK